MGSFADGFGLGSSMFNQSQIMRMRQDEMDQAKVERDLRVRGLEGDLADKDLERKKRDSLTAAGQDVGIDTSYTKDISGMSPEEVQAQAERMSYGEDMGNAEQSVGAGTSAKQFTAASGGLDAAKAYQATLNSPDEKIKRVAKQRFDNGDVDGSEKMLLSHETNKKALYDAQRTSLYNLGLENGPEWAVDGYNKHYTDGRTAELQPGDNGSGIIIQRDAKGNEVGRVVYKDKADWNQQWRGIMLPDKVEEESRASRVEIAKERAKVHAGAPGGSLVTGAGQEIWKSDRDSPTVEAAKWRSFNNGGSGGSGGSGSGGKGVALKTPMDEALSRLETSIKEDGTKSFSATQIASAQAAVREAVTMNPGINPEHAAQAGVIYAQNPGAATPRFNPQTGQFDDTVKTDFGQVVVRPNTLSYNNIGSMKPEDARAQVDVVAKGVAGYFGVDQEKVKAAAFDPAARREILEIAKNKLAASPNFSALPADVQAAKLKEFEAKVDAGLGNGLNWIHSYGSKPTSATHGQQKPATAKAAAEYGITSGPRLSYLQGLEQRKQLSPSDKVELDQLRESKMKYDKRDTWMGLPRPPRE